MSKAAWELGQEHIQENIDRAQESYKRRMAGKYGNEEIP
ncbi:MAG: hypothetical protein JWM59_2936 [Verrucomicrobiales bacterium]|nr:hypothetical protein [Verrucomicrobiales bacterium]